MEIKQMAKTTYDVTRRIQLLKEKLNRLQMLVNNGIQPDKEELREFKQLLTVTRQRNRKQLLTVDVKELLTTVK